MLTACASLATPAQAEQSARLHVTFIPGVLGRSTNVNVSVDIVAPTNRVPLPLVGLTLRYPRELGLDAGELGLTTCARATLEALGPGGCPADSWMGLGGAVAEILVGPTILHESVKITIVRAPEQEGHIEMLFYAEGSTPLITQITFPGTLLPALPPSDESVDIAVPLVSSFPEAPDVAIVALNVNLGTRNLVYYEHINDKLVAYHPRGILLPDRCPQGGFAFSATLSFLGGSHADAHATIPCSSHHLRRSPGGAPADGRIDTRRSSQP